MSGPKSHYFGGWGWRGMSYPEYPPPYAKANRASLFESETCRFIKTLPSVLFHNSLVEKLLLQNCKILWKYNVHWLLSTLSFQVNGKLIIKSGTDFREFSKITLNFDSKPVAINVEKIEVTSKFPEDPTLKEHLTKYNGILF